VKGVPNKEVLSETDLIQRQSLPLEAKVIHSHNVIRAWHEAWEGNVSVSFSGGKDSVVLLHLVRTLYPEVPAVFCDTGLEFPEVREIVAQTPNTIILRPKRNFREVITKYGYPVVSKQQAQYIYQFRHSKSEKQRNRRWNGEPEKYKVKNMGKISERWKFLCSAPFEVSDHCCQDLKKGPLQRYEKESGAKPYVGVMASDSRGRKLTYMAEGCNAFTGPHPSSSPLAIWNEEDIWAYIKLHNLPYAKVYDMGYDRTGCVFCAFGVHKEGRPNRFERLAETHPKLYEYCMRPLDKGGLGMDEVLTFMKIPHPPQT
jgi:3'-phosphoadenosine 5'-phosphosulfate sulfotransferase (PAPS reductase)/FAD synthetase